MILPTLRRREITKRFTEVPRKGGNSESGVMSATSVRQLSTTNCNHRRTERGLRRGSNPSSALDTLKVYASLAYGNDNKVVLAGQYFDTRGTSDPILYEGLASGLSPNSNGYITEISYIPFMNSNAPVWLWANARIGLQYTYYDKFDGTTVDAQDNNMQLFYT